MNQIQTVSSSQEKWLEMCVCADVFVGMCVRACACLSQAGLRLKSPTICARWLLPIQSLMWLTTPPFPSNTTCVNTLLPWKQWNGTGLFWVLGYFCLGSGCIAFLTAQGPPSLVKKMQYSRKELLHRKFTLTQNDPGPGCQSWNTGIIFTGNWASLRETAPASPSIKPSRSEEVTVLWPHCRPLEQTPSFFIGKYSCPYRPVLQVPALCCQVDPFFCVYCSIMQDPSVLFFCNQTWRQGSNLCNGGFFPSVVLW